MTHYVCPACGGVSKKPGVCQTSGCAHKGQPFIECNCSDGKHAEVIKKNSAVGENTPPKNKEHSDDCC